MKISQTNVVIDAESYSSTDEWTAAREDVLEAIHGIRWPPGNDEFVIPPIENENGVGPITDAFERNLDALPHWEATGRKHFDTVLSDRGIIDKAMANLAEFYDNPAELISGPWFDAVKTVGDENDRLIAVEWETGNISSSHRSLNRLTIGLITGIISGGIVVLPDREFYRYLTDRVGNYSELEPYFLLWKLLESDVERGTLTVIAVQHDGAEDVRSVGKMTDGLSDREESQRDPDTEAQSNIGDYEE